MEDLIIPALCFQDFRGHSIRFDHEFRFSNPYNSTDVTGIRSLLKTLSQFFNQIKVQYYTDLQNSMPKKTAGYSVK